MRRVKLFADRRGLEMNIQAAQFHEFQVPEHGTISSIIARHAAARPKSPAILTSKNAALTYGDLWIQISAFGAALRANGIGPSARVALLLPDGYELAAALIATACNAIAVPINPKLTPIEVENLFARVHIDAIVMSNKIDTAAHGLAAKYDICQFEVTGSGLGTFKISVRSACSTAAFENSIGCEGEPQPDDLAMILQTSATTGRSKLVPITHHSIVVNAERRRRSYSLTPDDRSFCVAPLYYARAIKEDLCQALLVGGSVACPDRATDGDFIDGIVSLEPTWILGGPTFHLTVLEQARLRDIPIRHRLRFIRVGSAPLSAAIRQELEEIFGVPVLANYACTECGVIAASAIAPEDRKVGTVGRPWPNEVAIRDEKGILLPPGQVGEIVVRGPTVTPGYLDDAETNHAAFVDGWFRTGDLGVIDAEGFLSILGRIKEFINRGGEKISPYEIENALLRHPAILEAAAFSVAHPRLGENLVAAVVLKPGANVTSAQIKIFLSQHLAPFKIPQQVLVKMEFPKGATGKTLRRELAEEAKNTARDAAPPLAPLHSQILEIWKALLGRSDIGIDDDFFEAGGDSLLATQMICEIEQATHQRIPPSALRNVFTIRDLAMTVLRGSPATMELVTCARQGHETSLFFCHGDYTSRGFYALRLADTLKRGQAVFLLHPYPQPDPDLPMEEIARAYVPHILQAHPNGPLYLAGHCNGGVLAWEIAHQLECLGREVKSIALLDTPSLNARPIFRGIARLKNLAVATAPEKLSKKFARHSMRTVWGRERHANGPFSRAISNYIPPPTAARVLCIISEECSRKKTYSWMPWTRIAGDVCCKYVPGSHFSSITQHIDVVAQLLDDCISRAS